MTLTVTSAKQHADDAASRHPVFYFDDGSLLIQAHDQLFKVHRSLLSRHSPILSTLIASHNDNDQPCTIIQLPDELNVTSSDLEALLEHIYHDVPIDSHAPFARIAAVLRISSDRQLHFPSIHRLALTHLQLMFPNNFDAFSTQSTPPPHEALALALEFDIYSIQKPLFYVLSTTSHPDSSSSSLPASITDRCSTLLDDLIAHFTPVLFTVATAQHMPCTDTFAEHWMPLVIQPALENNGLCTPIETLQAIIDIEWRTHGVCPECVKDKADEWRAEQRTVWDKLDDWLGLRGKV